MCLPYLNFSDLLPERHLIVYLALYYTLTVISSTGMSKLLSLTTCPAKSISLTRKSEYLKKKKKHKIDLAYWLNNNC